MSKGRWVWCPVGWKVVPPANEWTEKMWDAFAPQAFLVEDLEEAIAAAPEPPSGWQQGPCPSTEVRLAYDPRLKDPEMRWYVGAFNATADGELWTPLPPPPEEA